MCAQLVVRPDDQETVVKARFADYLRQTDPLLEFYRQRQLLHTIPSPTSRDGYKIVVETLKKLGY